MPIIYAHRGGAALAPENTIAAFDRGLACGADGLELDVHLARDGVVVVHHDDTVERTTNGRGAIRLLASDELARLDAGYRFERERGSFPFRGQGIGIPTLQAVLRRYPSAHLIVELKEAGPYLARQVVKDVRDADAMDRVSVGSYFGDALRVVRREAPAIRTGAAKTEIRWALYRSWIGWPLKRPAYREFQVPECSGATRIVSERFVRFAHDAGVAVKIWTVNEEADMRRLLSWGVDGIITDRPDVAHAIVRAQPAR